jgi:hypothetical protein
MPDNQKKPILPVEAITDVAFPVSGVDVSLAYEDQRQGTTPVGSNVRTYEPLTQRARGGSRPGLVPYLPQLPNGAHQIQHINFIVDPQADALGISFPDIPGDGFYTIFDPLGLVLADGSLNEIQIGGSGYSTNSGYKRKFPQLIITPKNQTKFTGNTFIFTGNEYTQTGLKSGDAISSVVLQSQGSPANAATGNYTITASNAVVTLALGHNPYHIKYKTGTMKVSPATITLVQENNGTVGLGNLTSSMSFTTDDLGLDEPQEGNVLIVYVGILGYAENANAPPTAVRPILTDFTDEDDVSFSLVVSADGNISYLGFSYVNVLSTVAIFYYVVPTDGPVTFSFSFTGLSTSPYGIMCVQEWSGIDTSSPIRGFSNGLAGFALGNVAVDTGTISAVNGDLIVALMSFPYSFACSLVADAPFTADIFGQNPTDPLSAQYLISATGAMNATGNLTISIPGGTSLSGSIPSIGASFKPS